MPQCILEHSNNIKNMPSWEKLFNELHKILIDTGEWIESDIKSRVIEYNNFYIGDGSPNQAFVTLSIQILDGRNDELKKSIADNALNILCKYFESTFKKLQTNITVQINDIHSPSYCRKINMLK